MYETQHDGDIAASRSAPGDIAASRSEIDDAAAHRDLAVDDESSLPLREQLARFEQQHAALQARFAATEE